VRGQRRSAAALVLRTADAAPFSGRPSVPIADDAPTVTFIGDSWTVGRGATDLYGYAPRTADRLGRHARLLGVGGSGYSVPGPHRNLFAERIKAGSTRPTRACGPTRSIPPTSATRHSRDASCPDCRNCWESEGPRRPIGYGRPVPTWEYASVITANDAESQRAGVSVKLPGGQSERQPGDTSSVLNRLGGEGWELVSYHSSGAGSWGFEQFWLKRQTGS
jgi:hypothetical protein